MKVNKVNDQLHTYNVAQAQLNKQREFDYQKFLEKKKHDIEVQETRTERAKRLDLNKGRNVDVDC